MEPLNRAPVYRFGTFEVSFESGEVRRAGLRLRVQQQPLKILQILLERPGEVISREELRSRAWTSDGFGDFDQAVNIAIGKLRSALGDSADNPRYIETLPKRGYRFIAEVAVVDLDDRISEVQSVAETTMEPVAPEPYRWRPRRIVVAAFVCLALAGGVIWLAFSPVHRPVHIRSLAVLPLSNFSGDPSQDYLADGTTDELITDLAQVRALRVVSRTSVMTYKGTHKTLEQIANELSVDAIVEGSVSRSGDQVRITARLIQVHADKHLWARSYQGYFRDSLTVQNQVARDIAEEIQIELTPREKAALKSSRIINPEAYEAYLRGRYSWNRRTADGLRSAVDYFNDSTVKDPNYAPAFSGLADTYALLGDWQYSVMPAKEAMPKALAAARKAVELDDSLGEAHASIAFCLEGFSWDFASADEEFRRAVELSPGYATAHHWYAWHLSLMGRNNDALTEMKRALNLDPVSPIMNADLAELLLIAHRPDESLQQSRRTIAMNPEFALAHNQLAQAYIEKRMFGEAIAELQQATRLAGDSPLFVANLARAYIGNNRRPEAIDLLNSLRKRSNPTSPLTEEIAMIHAALGEKDQAIAWLEKGYDGRFNPGVLERPCFDSLRSDLRFQDLLRRIGLPH